MSNPTFEQIMAYQRRQWRKEEIARFAAKDKAKGILADPKPGVHGDEFALQSNDWDGAEMKQPEKTDYSTMSRSDLFRLAKERGYSNPWIASTKEVLLDYLNNA